MPTGLVEIGRPVPLGDKWVPCATGGVAKIEGGGVASTFIEAARVSLLAPGGLRFLFIAELLLFVPRLHGSSQDGRGDLMRHSVPSPFLCNLDSADYARRPSSGPSRLACTHA